jgi:hypothetical protein
MPNAQAHSTNDLFSGVDGPIPCQGPAALQELQSRYLLGGALCVRIIPEIGPDKGVHILSFTPRKVFEKKVREFHRDLHRVCILGSKKDPRIVRIWGPTALKEDVGADVRRGLLDHTLQDGKFYTAIAELGALRLLCGDSVLKESNSGVASIGLVADPDESLSWRKRGMLDPRFLKKYGHPSLFQRVPLN